MQNNGGKDSMPIYAKQPQYLRDENAFLRSLSWAKSHQDCLPRHYAFDVASSGSWISGRLVGNQQKVQPLVCGILKIRRPLKKKKVPLFG